MQQQQQNQQQQQKSKQKQQQTQQSSGPQQQSSSQQLQGSSRPSRNNKKKHHATHDATGTQTKHNNRQNQLQQQQSSNTANNSYVACKICKQELQDIEKEFFPCNCKYKICQKCFWHHVNNENGKCPNCGLLYEVNRVKEYYATKKLQQQQQTSSQSKKQQPLQLQGGASKKTRCESPQPSMTPAKSLAQGRQPHSTSMQAMTGLSGALVSDTVQGGSGGKNRGKQNQNAQRQKGGGKNNKDRQQNNQQQQPSSNVQHQHMTKQQQKNAKSANNQHPPQSDEASKQINEGEVVEGLRADAANSSKIKEKPSLQLTQSSSKQQTSQQNSQQLQQQRQQQTAVEGRPSKKQRNSSEQQRLQQKLSSVRILQRNTLYVIGLSPNVAKEDTLRRYEYFSQYGRIQSVTINKEKAFQSENQGLCFSAYINYANERDASLAILAVDQFVFDGRLLHASYGRTKYCRFFLKGTNCLNHDCPYLHKEAHPENILTQEDMNKKILFQQCQQLALKLSKLTTQTEEQFRASLRAHKDTVMRTMKLNQTNRIIMPQLEQIFEKKGVFKHCLGVVVEERDDNTVNEENQAQSQSQPQPQVPIVQKSQQTPSLQNNNVSGIAINSMSSGGPAIVNNQPSQPNKTTHASTYNKISKQQPPEFHQSLSGTTGVLQPPQGLTPDMKTHNSFKQHRGSEGCNSEMQVNNPNMMMMFGGRNRLQSSGTLGELEFQNQNSANHSRWQQLIPQGPANQNRRFAQDDHYLTRVPPAFRLTTANPLATMNQRTSAVNLTFQNRQPISSGNFGQLVQPPRFGSPVPAHQNRLYFQQQQHQQHQQQYMTTMQHQPKPSNVPQQQTNLLRDSEQQQAVTQQQQSSSQYQYLAAQKQYRMSQLQYHQPHQQQSQQQMFLQHTSQGAPVENRARSGSQAAAYTDQFEEAKIPQRRRDQSHGKFRIFEEPRKESPSPGNKEEQGRFAEALRQALQQFIKGDTAQEGDSTEQFSSIFAGGERGITNKIIFNQNNCSEGEVRGHACSPIRDSILLSRRNSEDYGTMTRPRSQHSLIVESVARILDDTALEQRGGDRGEKQRMQTLNMTNFKTGPPSEVHQLMYEEHPSNLNSHFYKDFESKWNNQFEMTSSNSLNMTKSAIHGANNHTTGKQATLQTSMGVGQQTRMNVSNKQQQQQTHLTFTSPNVNTSAGGVWNKSGSFYNSPFFLIPTHTSNQLHRSAAFHDHSLRHLHGHSNNFSLGGHNTTMGARENGGGMINDTWRLTYNPHPLLPRGVPTQGGAGAPSSNLSSAGGFFKKNTTTTSDQEHIPMLNRTASQPFMMRSEQKVIRGNNKNLHQNNAAAQRTTLNNSARLGFSSQMKQAQLTQRNLEILNKKYYPSKDMLYAKIFTDYQPSSPSNLRKNNKVSSFGGGVPQHPISAHNYSITPQSLFCFALDGDDSNELRQSTQVRGLKLQKQVSRDDAAGIFSTPSHRKEPSLFGFGSSHLQDKVKETSMTPTNKHSRKIGTNWNEGEYAAAQQVDTLSMKHQVQQRGSGLMPRESRERVDSDELEMANQLANEASLGFGDLISMMHTKSKKSQHAGTHMSAVDGECPPQRSRSQSYRDRPAEAQHSNMFEESERKQRRDQQDPDQVVEGNLSNRRDSSNRSDSSLNQIQNRKKNLAMKKQQTSHEQSVATATSIGGQKNNFYQEFVKVQEGFRKSSGLVSTSGFGATKIETRRSSYSQGRNSSNKTTIQLLDITRRGSFKQGANLRKSLIVSPLGLLKFKNHQIDEVNEDGATVKEETLHNEEDPTSVRMNSLDRQSYNLKTLKSVSRSRKASHSQNNDCHQEY